MAEWLDAHGYRIVRVPADIEPRDPHEVAGLLAGQARRLAQRGRQRLLHRGDPRGGGGGGLRSELDEVTGWLAARAADNFLHLLRLLEAERAWALGDFRAAELGFDAARGEAASRRRPWHRALITERVAVGGIHPVVLVEGGLRAALEALALPANCPPQPTRIGHHAEPRAPTYR
jgi:hypothetical protein